MGIQRQTPDQKRQLGSGQQRGLGMATPGATPRGVGAGGLRRSVSAERLETRSRNDFWACDTLNYILCKELEIEEAED